MQDDLRICPDPDNQPDDTWFRGAHKCRDCSNFSSSDHEELLMYEANCARKWRTCRDFGTDMMGASTNINRQYIELDVIV